jgi:lipopolysaccharide heptosyltransferase I
LKRALIVRLGALGDIVHAVPVAAALRRAFPEARIDWLVSARHRQILDLLPILDRRIAVADRGGSTEGAPMLATIGALRRTHYDVAIDVQGLIKSAVVARASGARRVIGFSSRYLREPLARLCYTHVYDPGGEGIFASTETRHVVQLNLGLLTPLGIDDLRAEFPFVAPAAAAGSNEAARPDDRYALLNPGAAWPNKRWPPDRLAQVATALRDRHGLASVVLWGPGERDLAQEVVALAGGAARLAPETSIAEIFDLARAATLMVSGDTGPTHIGSAVGTPIVGIYGPTRPERNGPWHAGNVVVSRADRCRCHHLRRCTQPRMCLLDIEVPEVLHAVERRLAATPAHG